MNLSTFKQLQIAQTSGYVVPGFTGLGFRQGGKGGVVSLGTIYLNSKIMGLSKKGGNKGTSSND